MNASMKPKNPRRGKAQHYTHTTNDTEQEKYRATGFKHAPKTLSYAVKTKSSRHSANNNNQPPPVDDDESWWNWSPLMKGLEPEIERIMDKHKADMEDLERGHHVSKKREGRDDDDAKNYYYLLRCTAVENF